MEKLKITSLYWIIMILGLLFTTDAFAQVDDGNNNNDDNGGTQPPSLVVMDEDEGGNGDPRDLDPYNDITLCYSIQVTNLTPLFLVDPDSLYQLSPNYPDMGLSYTVGGNTGVIKFMDFQIVDTVMGHPVFQSEVCIDLDFSAECAAQIASGNGSHNTIHVTGHFDIVDISNNNALYPIAPYSGANSLFSCEVFDETCGYCSHMRCSTSTITEISFDIDYYLTCYAVNGFGGGKGGDGENDGSTDRNAFKSSNPINTNASIFPNPAQQLATLQYYAQEAQAAQVQLFDATGKMIAQLPIQAVKGLNQQSIDLSELENGLYYGRLYLNNQLESFKIIKTE